MYKRKNGIFYTPDEVSEILVNYLFQKFPSRIFNSVLEPSCGMGSFLDPILKIYPKSKITGVEKDKRTATKLSTKYKNKKIEILNKDFLNACDELSNCFDLIIGNPPYVDQRKISTFAKKKSNVIFKRNKLQEQRVMNLWQPFVIQSLAMMKKNGVFCFILPAELMQVSYAKEIRELILKSYSYVEVITFKEKLFLDIDQKLIVIIATNVIQEDGLYWSEFQNHVDGLQIISRAKQEKKEVSDKWHPHKLSHLDSSLLATFSKKFAKVGDICNVAPGVVTGANDFFILKQNYVTEKKLNDVCTPILLKGEYVSHCIDFSNKDFSRIVEKNKSAFLLNLFSVKKLPKNVKNLIKEGEALNYDKGYKCSNRPEWYKVPAIIKGEAYFFKRIHRYPKLIKNSCDSLVTDTAYRIKMNEKYDIYSFIFSYYNSLTLACAELYGRVYGQVLELTPSEFRKLPIPYLRIKKSDFIGLDKLLRKEKNFETIVEYVDKCVLENHFKISNSEVRDLQNLRQKLTNYRVKTNIVQISKS